MLVERRFGEHAGRGRGVPRRRRALAARAVRRRARRAARAGARLQADRRRRHGPEHRRHGLLLAGARGRRRASSSEIARPSTSRSSTSCARRGTPFHGVLYAGLMLDRGRRRRCSSSTCRFGDPETQAVLPRLRSRPARRCSLARARAGRPGRRRARVGPAAARSRVVLASRGYPASSSYGRRDRGPRRGRRPDVEVIHAGTAERDGDDRHGRRPRAERDRRSAPTAAAARERPRMLPPTSITLRRASAAPRTSPPRRWSRGAPMSGRATRPSTETEVEDEFAEHRGRRAARRHHHGLRERHAGDGAGRRRSSSERGHPLRGPGDVGPSRPRAVADYCTNAQHARAAGDHRRRRPVGGAARASSPRTPTCR